MVDVVGTDIIYSTSKPTVIGVRGRAEGEVC